MGAVTSHPCDSHPYEECIDFTYSNVSNTTPLSHQGKQFFSDSPRHSQISRQRHSCNDSLQQFPSQKRQPYLTRRSQVSESLHERGSHFTSNSRQQDSQQQGRPYFTSLFHESDSSQQRSTSSSESSEQLDPETPFLPHQDSSSILVVEHVHAPRPSTSRRASSYYNRDLPSIPRESVLSSAATDSSTCRCCSCTKQPLKSEQHFIKRRYLICTVAFSIFLSSASCIFSGWNFSRNSPGWEQAVFKEGAYETCISCVQLAGNGGQNNELLRTLTQRTDKGTAVCCASTSGQMSALIQLIMDYKPISVAVASAHPTPRLTPVSAHKFLDTWSPDDVEELQFTGDLYRLKLRPGDDSFAEHARHVIPRSDSLQIEYTGWYLIYSGVYFKPDDHQPCQSLSQQTWGHFVNRHPQTRRSGPETLLQSSHTCCDTCLEDHHTSFTGGVFLLEAGDHVYVEVSRAGLVLFDGQASYLGLAMLGSLEPSKGK